MFDLLIQSSTDAYSITVGQGSIERFFDSEFTVIADSKLVHAASAFSDRVIYVEADEKKKNLATCEEVIEKLKALGCNRDTVLVAIGGGYIQDIATLVSSLYMRGIDWIYVPTTLMSMLDSCIGGKSSINVGSAKNLIGNFYPPKEIVIDVDLLATLDARAIASGLAEGVKICYAKGAEEFNTFCLLRKSIEKFDSATGAELIAHVLNAKKWFVEVDEFDQGPRKLLNFGHTFAHALESATNFSLPHGIAVGLGVLAALSHPSSLNSDLENSLKSECLAILEPVRKEVREGIAQFDTVQFVKAFQGDKKHSRSHFRLVLPHNGAVVIVEIERSESAIEEALIAMRNASSLMGSQ